MKHFADVARVPGDPILGLLDAYRADPNPAKLDLSVGVYKDALGLTPIPAGRAAADRRAQPVRLGGARHGGASSRASPARGFRFS